MLLGIGKLLFVVYLENQDYIKWYNRIGLFPIRPGLTDILPHARESNTVLDSGFHAVDSGFQLLDSNP